MWELNSLTNYYDENIRIYQICNRSPVADFPLSNLLVVAYAKDTVCKGFQFIAREHLISDLFMHCNTTISKTSGILNIISTFHCSIQSGEVIQLLI